MPGIADLKKMARKAAKPFDLRWFEGYLLELEEESGKSRQVRRHLERRIGKIVLQNRKRIAAESKAPGGMAAVR